MSKNKLKIEGLMTLPHVITRLEELLESMKKGAVRFQLGEEGVTVFPAEVLNLELKIAKKKDKEKISFELTWDVDPDAEKRVDVSISSIAPE